VLYKITKWIDSIGSKRILMISKICFAAGAGTVALSVAFQMPPSSHFNATPLVAGFILLAVGFYLHRKARIIERRYEWREKYNTVAA
jgi:hypothetical protein